MSDYVPHYAPISEDDPSLDLSLALNYPPSNKKYQSAPQENKKEEGAKEVFSCMFCHRVFKNPQALGGHQNSHRFERERIKKEKERLADIAGSMFNTPMHPYAAPSMYGTLNRPLAVNRSALIHKPYASNRLMFGYGSQAMPYMLSPRQYPLVPNGVQSWPPKVQLGMVDPNEFRAWIPIGLTNEGSSSGQTFQRSDEGASGSSGGGNASNGGHAEDGRSFRF